MKTLAPTYSTITGPDGSPTAVIVPIKEFERMARDARKLQQMEKLRKGLTQAFHELSEYKAGRLKLPTYQEFIDEL
jgi:hypothetical protein